MPHSITKLARLAIVSATIISHNLLETAQATSFQERLIQKSASADGRRQAAGELHTPSKGSTERQGIIDALREKYQKDNGESVVFKVNYMKAHQGWAWVDTTPLDAKGQPVAEGGTSLLHHDGQKWIVLDLSVIADDPKDPMGSQDASPGFVKNLRRKYPAVPVDIFPRHAH